MGLPEGHPGTVDAVAKWVMMSVDWGQWLAVGHRRELKCLLLDLAQQAGLGAGGGRGRQGWIFHPGYGVGAVVNVAVIEEIIIRRIKGWGLASAAPKTEKQVGRRTNKEMERDKRADRGGPTNTHTGTSAHTDIL